MSIKYTGSNTLSYFLNKIKNHIDENILDKFSGTVEVTSEDPEKENTVLTINPGAEEVNVYTVEEVDEKIGQLQETIADVPIIHYGVCESSADAVDKVITVDDKFELKEGAIVVIKFTNANSASTPTLNVNGTGAKPMYRYGTTVISTATTTTGWTAGAVQMFVYDGVGWVRDYWSNTTYSNADLGHGYVTCSTAEATTDKTASLSSYALTAGGTVSVKFSNAVPANATLNINSKGAKAIYYRGAKITADVIKAGDIATFIYSSYYHLISIDRWQNDIDSLTMQINELRSDEIPDYWKSELETKAEEIRLAMENVGRNKSAFLWYTDAHWEFNSKKSPLLLKYLAKNTPINKVNFGGDIVCDPSSFTHDNIKYVYDWRNAIADLPNHHSVYGNHDVNHRNSSGIDATNKLAYALLIAPEESSDMVVGGDSYYYIDNPSEKTRYLYLSYTTRGIGLIELESKFIVEALTSVPDGWHIVAISHRWWNYTSSSNPTVGSVSEFEAEVLEIFDTYNARKSRSATAFFESVNFANAKGKVEFCIGGHIHVDYDFFSTGGIPVINTTADTNQNRVPDSTVDSGTVGTITESAVFGIIADYSEDVVKVTVVGVGRGTSRVVRGSTVKPTSITGISYSGDTTVGNTIDKSKFDFTVNYSDSSTTSVNGASSVTPTTIQAIGNNSITITYVENGVTLTGTVTIVGKAKERVNLFDKNDSDIHDTGRFNSSNAVVNASANQLVTGYFEASIGDVFTVETDKALNSTSYTGDLMYYKADKTPIGKMARETPTHHSYSSDYLTGTYEIVESYRQSASVTFDFKDVKYVRFCVAYTSKDNIKIYKE